MRMAASLADMGYGNVHIKFHEEIDRAASLRCGTCGGTPLQIDGNPDV